MFTSKKIQANELIEITLESQYQYTDTFHEITIDVIFSEPSGQKLCIPAFWAGESTWRFRYSSDCLGIHHYVTNCSDIHNEKLHQISGEIEVSAYTGFNPLLKHGPVRIATDNRHFAHKDGTPFFWLGDTWWMGLTKRLVWPEQFKELTIDRKNKGFNVVQIVAGLYPDMPAFDQRGANEEGFPWKDDYSSINPKFFDAADKRIFHLVDQAIVPCILGCWGFHLLWLGKEKMKLHWRYLIARWGALPVVWSAAGEQTMSWYLSATKESDSEFLKQEWTKVIRYMKEVDGFKRLITTHPCNSARESVEDPHLLDFEMQQTGHHNPTEFHAAIASQAWNTKPIMPVISAESRYEGLGISPPVTTQDTRQAFWAHLLNSGCAGHTYGANGVWQVNELDKPFGKSPGGNDWGNLPWNKAMLLVGSNQLAASKRFLQTLPWNNLQSIGKPKNRLATFISLFTNANSAVAAATSPDGKIGLYYFLSEKPVVINMQKFTSEVEASWVDPTNGDQIAISNILSAHQSKAKLSPPGLNADGDTDWILMLLSE